MPRRPGSLEQIARSRRWTEEDARVVIDALSASGLSVASFATAHGVQAQRVHAWRRKLDGAQSIEKRAPAFVEVDAKSRSVHSARYELALPDGSALRVEGEIAPDEVRTLFEILRAASSC
jgi:transposase-like protein